MARLRIGDMLVKARLIDEMQLSSALAHQKKWGGRLGDVLIELGFLDEMMLWKGLSKQLGLTREVAELEAKLDDRIGDLEASSGSRS